MNYTNQEKADFYLGVLEGKTLQYRMCSLRHWWDYTPEWHEAVKTKGLFNTGPSTTELRFKKELFCRYTNIFRNGGGEFMQGVFLSRENALEDCCTKGKQYLRTIRLVEET